MPYDSKYYLHKTDKGALKALKAVPGFHQLMKLLMKVYSERQFRILNMSSRVRINEIQLERYYNMLPPICEKLGIEVPELYLEMDPNPNSYTSGDTKPFIVITSGLIETIPDDLMPTVLAHECGHIACHHVLYSTMGRLILRGASELLMRLFSWGTFAIIPIQVAFYYWIRCSEFSADRAAVLCDGSPDKMIEVCMRLAGYDKDVDDNANVEEFMAQANEYREMVHDSKWDKTLEFITLSYMDHPLMAVRALECKEWAASENYQKILDGTIDIEDIEEPEEIEIKDNTSEIIETLEENADVKGDKELKLFGKKLERPKFLKKGDAEGNHEEKIDHDPDTIRKYKALLDDGLITEEEYEKKKKEILGL